MSTNSQSFRAPFAGTRRFGSPPSVEVQPPLKKQRIDASGASEGHDIALSLSLPERSAMDPSILVINTEEDPLPDVNPVSAATRVGSSASKHTSGAANPKKKPKRKKRNRVSHEVASPGDVLWREVQRLIGIDVAKEIVEARQDFTSPFEFGDELVVEVLEVGAGGDGLALAPAPNPPWVITVPFTLPGEKARVKITTSEQLCSKSDLLEIITPNEGLREMSRVECRYFGKCGGCQFQMLDYATQLQFKQRVVERAYDMYTGSLPSGSIPPIGPTIPSPKRYGYRTKITPHFDVPSAKRAAGWEVTIGFGERGRATRILDIEECPIASPVLNKALPEARKEVIDKFSSYKKGATLLMRDSWIRPSDGTAAVLTKVEQDGETHVCIRDHHAIVREKVGNTLFEFPANSFFQNNNSALPALTSHVADAIFNRSNTSSVPVPTHLVDAYCGSGLFAIILQERFQKVAGVEIDANAIKRAKLNVELNAVEPLEKMEFLAGSAEAIFATVQAFPRLRTALIIDPPRRGCDEAFLTQMLEFGAGTVVYVSCNVHSQARDVEVILRGQVSVDGGERKGKYVLESVRGLDLFPQTSHVESIAVLRLV